MIWSEAKTTKIEVFVDTDIVKNKKNEEINSEFNYHNCYHYNNIWHSHKKKLEKWWGNENLIIWW